MGKLFRAKRGQALWHRDSTCPVKYLFHRAGQALWNKLHYSTGQAYIELILVLPILLILIAAVIFFGRILYLKIALDMASYDGVRAAVEALNEQAGISQGVTAAHNTLAGFHIDPTGARIEITPVGPWTRGTRVYCRVSYQLNVGDIPFLGSFFSGLSFPLHSTTWSRVETLKSEW